MATYLFTWNPKRWQWNDLSEMVNEVNTHGSTLNRWSCGNTKKIQPNDRAFLIRLGVEPKGIMASGQIKTTSYEATHWDKTRADAGELARYVDIDFDVLLNPDKEPILPRSQLQEPPLDQMHWDAQTSGTTISESVAVALEQEWALFLEESPRSVSNVIAEPMRHYEGAVRQVQLTRYERDSKARKRCIEHYGTSCCVCGFDFERTYGDVGAGYIHVHHLTPLSDIGGKYEIDPVNDLRPVCPNCHAIIHRRRPPYSIEEVQQMRGGI